MLRSLGLSCALLALVLGSISLPTLVASSHSTPAAIPSDGLESPSPPHRAVPVVPAYRPVIIPAGNTTWWNGSGSSDIRLQQGSVTIAAGGTLVVQNLTLSVVQFVTSSGTLAQRLSNVSWFLDEGTVILRDAVLTTDAHVTDAYLKLNLTVTGNLSLWRSSFEFPGWVNIDGGATVTLNQSTITSNPDVNNTGLSRTIVGDTSYAPAVSVHGGGRLILLNSSLQQTYADNTSANGKPGVLPLTETETFTVSPTAGRNLTAFQTPSDTASLLQDWLYPTGFYSGSLSVQYNSSSGIQLTPTVDFNGSLFSLAAVGAPPSTSWTTATTPLSRSLVSAINHLGVFQYLLDTGSFSTPPSSISVNLSSNSLGIAQVRDVAITLDPPLDYNVLVTGQRALLESMDSMLDVNWAPLPFNPLVQYPPYPWDSHKIVVTGGAETFLGNVSIPQQVPVVGSTSAVLADSSSPVFTYRWAAFGAEGPGGPIPGAKVVAYSESYGRANATVTALNQLSQMAPGLWAYIQWWDGQHGLPGYGLTGSSGAVDGRAFLLLAASNLTGSTSSNATFVGMYHVGVTVPVTGVSTSWSHFNVTPYPNGLVDPHPDVANTSFFPQYAATLVVTGLSFSVNGHAVNGLVRIGQLLRTEVRMTNVGASSVFNFSGRLLYAPPGLSVPITVAQLPLTTLTVPSGGTAETNLSWSVNESTVGVHGTIYANLTASMDWNGGPSHSDGGRANRTAPVEVLPSLVTITDLQAPPHNLTATATYVTSGVIVFNGSGLASIYLAAVPVGGGPAIRIATNLSGNGSFQLTYGDLGQVLEPGVSYAFVAGASYNGQNATPITLPGHFGVVPSPVSPSGLALPWWLWAIVAIGAITAIIVVLVRRRRPAPRRECGECASLVSPEATACPACGTYFETGESRCPRCGGPIPAGQPACPECEYIPSDRLAPPGSEEDRQEYRRHIEQFRAAAQGELGEDYPEIEFWRWWRHQPSFQSFRDWQSGQTTPRRNFAGDGEDTLGIGDGR